MRHTKRTLLFSALSIVLCVAMLAATTFAWFTDTATTGVNQIKSGRLDLALLVHQDPTNASAGWVNGEGKTLSFRNVKGETNILWEPGATFKVDAFKLVNQGNLALKYDVKINGVKGDAKLLKAIDFTVQIGNEEAVKLDDWKGVLLPTGATPTVDKTPAEEVGTTEEIVISGTMKSDAGNEYQGLTLDGLGIVVNATQYSYEVDSKDNTYDDDADMSPDNLDKQVFVNKTVTLPAEITETVTIGDAKSGAIAEIPASAIDKGATEVTFVVMPTTKPDAVRVESNKNTIAYEVKVEGLADSNTVKIPVKIYNVPEKLQGVELYHNDKKIECEYATDDNGTYVGFSTASFSPFTIAFDSPMAKIGDVEYNTLHDAILAAKDGETVVLTRDATGRGLETKDSGTGQGSITVDFGGHTYTVVNPAAGSNGTESQAMHWGPNATAITLKNGTLVVSQESNEVRMIMQNYVALTVENMTIDGTSVPVDLYNSKRDNRNYGVYDGHEIPFFNTNGVYSMTLKNCTITLPATATKGVYVENGILTLEGTTINGPACIDGTGSIVIDTQSTVTKGIVPYLETKFNISENPTGTYKLVEKK